MSALWCSSARRPKWIANWQTDDHLQDRVGIEWSKIPQHVIIEGLDYLVDNHNLELVHTVKDVCHSGLLIICQHGAQLRVQTYFILLNDLSYTIRCTGHDYAANKYTYTIADTVWTVSGDPEKCARHNWGKNKRNLSTSSLKRLDIFCLGSI